MTRKVMKARNEKIVEYRKYHTLFETALHFNLSVNQVHLICKKAKQLKEAKEILFNAQ